ncbi:S41 family peptidase [Pedobacter sp. SG918]|uniref:S41 family peptidase n=1 Tax=Pedobacter sp. SG918 TaxID=2587136 RepID=UPI00146ADCA3|nr:S41 family peptidase [Pedobacter sp. SG918]NMN35942.1 C-terminal processing protease CtpA/Prc [Pedobacter sp. SG918]
MLRKFISQNTFWCALIIVAGLTASCKKSNNAPDGDNAPQAVSGTRAELTKDSIYLYAQQTYLWNVGMPSYSSFNPRQYNSNEAILAAIKALPSTGGKDKYSFIDDGSVATQLGGAGEDYGFSANFDVTDLLRVKYVYPGSPADVQGLKRGYQITKVNGGGTSRSSSTDIANLNASIFGNNPSISLTVLKPDNTTQDIVINRGKYDIKPILFSNTYTVGAKKVGYIVFNSFTTNALGSLDAAFTKFSTDGVTELVVDLRYNGGGSVATSEAFTNLIAPLSQNGKVMYTTYWTKTMQDGEASILQNQKFYAQGNDGVTRLYSYADYSYKPTIAAGNQEVFKKRGSLNNLTRVYFIVTGGTASASELLINNLKPVMDVKLIGKTTYGKPVGFFSIRIDKNDLYIPQFQTKNQLDQGEYFSGMTVDKDVTDDLTKDFGNPAEKMLAQALYYSANNTFMALAKDNALSSTSGAARLQIDAANEKLDHEFKGMVETRKLRFK